MSHAPKMDTKTTDRSEQPAGTDALALAQGSAGCTKAAKLWARKRTLENAIDALAEGLPDGWTVRLGIERGAAFVHVESPLGKETHIHEDDGDLYDHLRLAHRFAVESEPNTNAQPAAETPGGKQSQ